MTAIVLCSLPTGLVLTFPPVAGLTPTGPDQQLILQGANSALNSVTAIQPSADNSGGAGPASAGMAVNQIQSNVWAAARSC
jgi:hypothetical protein